MPWENFGFDFRRSEMWEALEKMNRKRERKNEPQDTRVDVLGIGAHPDDTEGGCGAFLLKMKKMGYRTGMVHLTRGEMGSGTPEIREAEAREAARILRVDVLEILDLGDCRVENNHENRVVVAGVLRKYRPKLILCPYYDIPPGRGLGHSDHIEAGHLVTHAANFAHLKKFPAQGKPYAADHIWYFMLGIGVRPAVLVPVDDEFPVAMKALKAHKSQFGGLGKEFEEAVMSSARRLGHLAGCRFALGFLPKDPLILKDPLAILEENPTD
jgi:bacillithiol biosynthesis deacetylase BshB1